MGSGRKEMQKVGGAELKNGGGVTGGWPYTEQSGPTHKPSPER